MKHPPANADNIFIVGPVAIYVTAAPEEEVRSALLIIQRYLNVAIPQLDKRYHARNGIRSAVRALPGEDYARGGSSGRE